MKNWMLRTQIYISLTIAPTNKQIFVRRSFRKAQNNINETEILTLRRILIERHVYLIKCDSA